MPTNQKKTHYDVLDVAEDISGADLKFAYGRALNNAGREEPDEVEAAIAAVRTAYATLNDPEQRRRYDALLAQSPSRRRARMAEAAELESDSGRPWIKWVVGALVIGIIIVMYARKKPDEKPSAAFAQYQGPSRSVNYPEPRARSGEPVPPTGEVVPASATTGLAKDAEILNPEALFAKLSPSVARINVMNAAGATTHTGSGVVIGPTTIVTNCHVALKGASLTARIGNDTLPATVDVADQEFDLCKLNVSDLNAPSVTLGNTADVRTGQRVYAIGAPQGLHLTLSDGLISSLREDPDGTILQTTAPVSPGSSGGGLFDASGRLVGIVTFQFRTGQNLNFAVPVNWLSQMRTRASTTASSSAKVAAADDLREVITSVPWHCFGSVSGFNGTFTFGKNGVAVISSADGKPDDKIHYHVHGKELQLWDSQTRSILVLENMTSSKLIFVIGGGRRFVCDAR